MKPTGMMGIRLAGVVLLSVFALGDMSAPSVAAKPLQKEALAACRAQYGKKVVNAIVDKSGKVTCQWQVRREMTREEVYEACKKKYGGTNITVRKKSGSWICRYYGRF